MVAINFSVMEGHLKNGLKRQTIRRYSESRFNSLLRAEKLEIYWKQRTTQCRKLFDARLKSITVFRFSDMAYHDLINLSAEDGFNSHDDMRSWFIEKYGEEAWKNDRWMAIKFTKIHESQSPMEGEKE